MKYFFTKPIVVSIRDLVRQYKKLFIINVFFVLAGASLEGFGVGLLVPIMESINVGQTGDSIFTSLAKEGFLWLGVSYNFLNLIIVFSSLILLKYAAIVAQQRLSRVLSSTVVRDFRLKCVSNLLSTSLSFFHRKKLGDLITTIFISTQNSGGILEYLILLIRGIIFAISYLIVAFVLSPELTITMMLFVVSAYFFVWPKFKKGRLYGQKEKELMDDINSNLHDKIGGIKVIKQFSTEGKMLREVRILVNKYQKNDVNIMDNKLISYVFFEPFLFLILITSIVISVELLSVQVSVL